MVKVTQAMIDRAERQHLRTESHSSLRKQHALEYLRAKQQGNKKAMSYYSFARKDAEKLEVTKPIKRTSQPRTQFGIRNPFA